MPNIMKDQNNPHTFGSKAAILSCSILLLTASMTTPALAEIQKAFPEASAQSVQLIATIPSLMSVFFSFIAGVLMQKMSIKKVSLITLPFLFLGGILPSFASSLPFILAMRIVYGAAYGIMGPVGAAAIARFYNGDEARKMTGVYNAIGAVAGVIFLMLGGVLAGLSWRYTFFGFLCVLPILLLILFKMPVEENVSVPTEAQTDGQKEKKLTGMTWFLFFIEIIIWIFAFSMMTDTALIMDAEGLGNSTQSAIVMTLFSIVAFPVGLIYAKIYDKIKLQTMTLSIAFLSIGFLILTIANTYEIILAGATFYGIGYGLLLPILMTLFATSATKKEYTSITMSFFTAGMGIGQFLSPYILLILKNMFGLTSVRSDWTIASIGCLALLIISGIVMLLKSKWNCQ